MKTLKELTALLKAGRSVRLPGVGPVKTVADLEEYYPAAKKAIEAAAPAIEARRREVRMGRGGLVAPGTTHVQQAIAERDAEIARLKAELEEARAAATATANASEPATPPDTGKAAGAEKAPDKSVASDKSGK